MKVERIRRVSEVTKIEDRDLTDRKFKENLEGKRKKFQKKLRQDASKEEESTFDKERLQAEANIDRMAADMRINYIDTEEQEK